MKKKKDLSRPDWENENRKETRRRNLKGMQISGLV